MAALREFRRRYLSFVPTGDAARAIRARYLRRLGLARARVPTWLVEHPSYRVASVLRYAAADVVARTGELRFLQIGSFDGQADDDLREVIDHYACRGVLVEPQPKAFARLSARYGADARMTLLNAAIDRVSGEREFFMPSDRMSVVASFDRDHLITHGVLARDIVATPVVCLSVDDALAAANLARVDLIQIDAEGYDAEILKSIDLERWQPTILRFEFAHLRRRELDESLARLGSCGYRFVVEEKDLLAIRRGDTGARSGAA